MKTKDITNPIQLPSTLTDADITVAFAGHPDALALLTPYLRDFLTGEPEFLATVVDLLIRQAEQRATVARLQREIVQNIRQLLPAAFLQSLPATLQGVAQEQSAYWLEPEVEAVRPDSQKYVVSGACPDVNHWVANSMGPRFLNGVSYVVEEVLPGEELVPGTVYRLVVDGNMLLSGGTTFRLVEVKQSERGPYLVVAHDADVCPEGEEDRWAFRLGEPGWHLFRFLHYKSFRGLELPTQAFPVRPWAAILERGRVQREREEQRRATRRAAHARRKAQSALSVDAAPVRALALAA